MAILTAAIQLTAEVGYAGLTIEGIAARSGAGKQTIYRWWPAKADVLLDALSVKADLYVRVADQGGYAADLRAFLGETFALARVPQVADVLRALMAEAQIDTGFGERFRGSFLQSRRDALGVLLDRARSRGDLPPHLTPGTAIDIVFGTLWYRLLVTHLAPDDRLADELVAVLTGSP